MQHHQHTPLLLYHHNRPYVDENAEPLLSNHHNEALASLPEEDAVSPALIGSESYEWSVIPDLDKFFRNLYMYHKDKGLMTILTARLLNQICTLGFLIVFSFVLLLCINWHAIREECLAKDTCDISQVMLYKHPLHDNSAWWSVFAITLLSIFTLYWALNVYDVISRLPDLLDVAAFCHTKLGVSERQVRTITWPEFVARIVRLQHTTRLCIQRDLSEFDIVARIMRRDNYMIGMLNKGVLPLHVPLAGLRHHFMLTKTLEWSLDRCIFDHMFDQSTFRVRADFVDNPEALQCRFRREALLMVVLSPFVLCFLFIYFFMRNAEKFYNHPASIGARRWSLLARWRMREFNELDHYVSHRLNASQTASEKYMAQFPSLHMSHVARFVAFVTGSMVALLLFVTLVDEKLLERPLYGRHLVWWIATLGILLAISRSMIVEPGAAFDPELAMMEVVAHTHYLPRHWRGRAHTREVQQQFQGLFQYKAMLFLEEVASVVLTPFVLAFSMPASAGAITRFVKDFTAHVDGVGDVCSLSVFDLQRHGNSNYGAPSSAPKEQRSRQGKMEKSLLSFVATYPTWEPSAAAKQMLQVLRDGGGGRWWGNGGGHVPPGLSPSASVFASAECVGGAGMNVAASQAALQMVYAERTGGVGGGVGGGAGRVGGGVYDGAGWGGGWDGERRREAEMSVM